MFEEVGTLQTLLVHCILAFILAGFFQFAELEVLDFTVVVFIPIFVIPRLTKRQELILSQFQRVYLISKHLTYGYLVTAYLSSCSGSGPIQGHQ